MLYWTVHHEADDSLPLHYPKCTFAVRSWEQHVPLLTSLRISLCNLPFLFAPRFRPALHSLFRTCIAHTRYSDVVNDAMQCENTFCGGNIQHVKSCQLMSGTISCIISDFVLSLRAKATCKKALTLKWMQMTMCISWYTRRPRNEAISISFIMQLLLRISFRSFPQKDIILGFVWSNNTIRIR